MKRTLLAATMLIGIASTSLAQTKEQGEVGIITGMVNGTYAKTAADLTILDNQDARGGGPLRVLPILGKGSWQNLQDILHLRGVDVGFVQADVLFYARARGLLSPDELAHIQYIAKLYDEEVHVIASGHIESMADLSGKNVNVDVEGSGSAMTAEVILSALGVNANLLHMPQAEALGKLAGGKGDIDAIIHVGGAPIPLLSNIPVGTLHFVPVDSEKLRGSYLPAEFNRVEYPNLVPENAPPVPTVAIGDVMAVYAWDPNSERGKKVARFGTAFFANFSKLLEPPHHPKWKEVNPTAAVPGWTRFAAAQQWIDQANSKDDTAEVDRILSSLTKEQKEALFTRFRAMEMKPNARSVR
jgi:TRAP transporter TAXI family solute receptor